MTSWSSATLQSVFAIPPLGLRITALKQTELPATENNKARRKKVTAAHLWRNFLMQSPSRIYGKMAQS